MAKTDLVRAISSGDLGKFKEYFERQYLDEDFYGESLLHEAAKWGTPEIVRFLLEQGADPNKRAGVFGANPLTYAARKGNLEIVKILMEAGANLDIDHPSSNPLLKAAIDGQVAVVEYLLTTGIDAHACYLVPTGALINALTQAEKGRNARVVEILKAHGCRLPVPGVDIPVWQPEPERRIDLTPEYKQYRQIIEYVQDRFGQADENGIQELLPQVEGMSVAINIIRPSDKHPYLVLFTNGMSDLPMTTPAGQEDWQYGELVMHLPPDWIYPQEANGDTNWFWPVALLRQMAYYPHLNKTWFGKPGAIVANEDPPKPLGPNTQQTCLLMLPDLYNLTPPLVRADGKPCHFFTVVPLYTEERDFALSNGMDAFLNRFVEREVRLTVDLTRECFAG